MAPIYVLDLWLIFINMVIQDHIGDPGTKNSTINLTNKEFVIVWSKERNLGTTRLMLVIVTPKRAEKFKFYDRRDFNAIYANEAAILNKFSSFGILKYADLVVLKQPCRPHRYR